MKRLLNILAISALSICPVFFSGCGDEDSKTPDYYEISNTLSDALEFEYQLKDWDGFYMTEDVKRLLNGERISFVDGSYIYYSSPLIYFTDNRLDFYSDLNEKITRVNKYDVTHHRFNGGWGSESKIVINSYLEESKTHFLTAIRKQKIWVAVCNENKVQTEEYYSSESFPNNIVSVNVGYGESKNIQLKDIGVDQVTDDYFVLNLNEEAAALLFKNGTVQFVVGSTPSVSDWYKNSIFVHGKGVSAVYDRNGKLIADNLHDPLYEVYPVSYTECIEFTTYGSLYKKDLTTEKEIWRISYITLFGHICEKTTFQVIDDSNEWLLIVGTNTLLDGSQEKVTFKLNINDGKVQII